MTTDPAESRPEWWSHNETLRRQLGLPEYEPPRFEDGTYTHAVVPEVERAHDCTIRFRSAVNPEYPDDWRVVVDRTPVARVGRHRDKNGNTVYELTAEQFRELVADARTGTPGRDSG